MTILHTTAHCDIQIKISAAFDTRVDLSLCFKMLLIR